MCARVITFGFFSRRLATGPNRDPDARSQRSLQERFTKFAYGPYVDTVRLA